MQQVNDLLPLDGMTTIEMIEFFKVPIRVAYSAPDLYHLLTEWK